MLFRSENWRESTEFRVVMMNSKRQIKGKLDHVVQIHVCLKSDAVNLSNNRKLRARIYKIIIECNYINTASFLHIKCF